ncbi:MAG TPA: endonuclease/exonuclease/phosphatase family protein [Pirellulales bacterium]|jgi:endonuclease/exonuclease/phosphatase family metal-dependent hydrolase|nr:endonuclease/exonuclease/phosphatase family protein [Pirellulales bacterium]
MLSTALPRPIGAALWLPWLLALCPVLALVSAARAADDEALRVMTFNIRYAAAPDGENAWNKRKELLESVVEKTNPDLLGAQEVLAGQADFLKEKLGDYTLVGVGRDDGKRAGEFTALWFRTSRFGLVDSGTFWLSETPEKVGSKGWDAALPRTVTWARLKDHAAGDREFYFLNTHWDHKGNQARIESGKIIRRWLAQHADNAPAIVTGDFNVNDDHEGYQALLATGDGGPKLVDAYRQVHAKQRADEATFHGFTGNRRGKPIDFILATPEFSASEATIIRSNDNGRYPSDHYPVLAVFRNTPTAKK